MRRQPASRARINWSNPITRGLEFAHLPGFLRDITGKYLGASYQGQFVPERRGGSILNYNSGTAGAQVGTGAPVLGGLANSSIVAIGVQTGSNNGALYCERAGSGNDIYKLEASQRGGAQFTYRNDGGTLLQTDTGDAGRTSGAVRFFAATKNSTTHTAYCGTIAGDRQPGLVTAVGTFGAFSTAFTDSGMVRSIGYDVADSTAYTNGRLDLVAGWSRTLSDTEIASLRNNPWQIFLAANDEADLAPFSTAGGTGSQLAGAAQVQAAAAGALTTAIPLSGLASAQAAGAAALSTSIRLAGAAQAVASASATFAGTGATLAGAAQVQASAAGALVTALTLAGNAGAQVGAVGALATSIPLSGVAQAIAATFGTLAGGGAVLAGMAASVVTSSAALSTSIQLAGSAVVQPRSSGNVVTGIPLGGVAVVTPLSAGSLTIASAGIDVSQIDPAHIAVFDGTGSRISVFDGTGSRIAVFDGTGARTTINGMTMQLPTLVNGKMTCNRDPDEISWYGADITQELSDRNTSPDSSKLTLDLSGVVVVQGATIQTATASGVTRTYVVVLLGGVEGDPPDDWHWTARVGCVNGERFDKTTYFNRVDT